MVDNPEDDDSVADVVLYAFQITIPQLEGGHEPSPALVVQDHSGARRVRKFVMMPLDQGLEAARHAASKIEADVACAALVYCATTDLLDGEQPAIVVEAQHRRDDFSMIVAQPYRQDDPPQGFAPQGDAIVVNEHADPLFSR